MKIGSKLIALFVIISSTVTITSSSVFFIQGRKALEERTKAQLESVVVLKAQSLNRWVDHRVMDIEDMTNLMVIKDNLMELNKEEKEKYKENIREVFLKDSKLGKDFLEFFIMNLDSKVLVSTDKTQEGKFKSTEHYFTEGKKETFVQSFYYDLTLQQPAMTIVTPIKDNKGNVIGVFSGRISLEEISKIMTERSGLGETGETYLVNKFNFLVSKSQFIEGIELKKAIYTEGVKDCLKGNNGNGYYSGYRGIPVIGSYMWIPEREVCLLAEIERKEAFTPINELKKFVITIGIGLSLITMIIGLLLSRSISSPIKKLTKTIEDISKGRFDVEIDPKLKESGDEIGDLAKAFERTIVSLKLAMKQTSPKLEKESKRLRKALEEKKEVEQALRESEKKFRTIFENVNDEIVYMDKTGKILDVNPRIEDLFGYRREEVLGKNFAKLGLFGLKEMANIVKLFANMIKTGETIPLIELEIKHKNGKKIPVEASTRFIKKDGKIEGILIILRDISERKMEKAD